MALIKCTKCGHEISDKATVCPKCGNKIAVVEKKKNSTTKIFIAVALLALLVCGAFFFLNKEDEANNATANVETVEAVSANEDNEFDRSKAKLLKVVKVEYSNSLAPQAGNNYEAKNLCDGDSTTAWAINLDKAILWSNVYCELQETISHNHA